MRRHRRRMVDRQSVDADPQQSRCGLVAPNSKLELRVRKGHQNHGAASVPIPKVNRLDMDGGIILSDRKWHHISFARRANMREAEALPRSTRMPTPTPNVFLNAHSRSRTLRSSKRCAQARGHSGRAGH
jgi:hypothetical protein